MRKLSIFTVILLIIAAFVCISDLKAQLVLRDTYLIDDEGILKSEFYTDGEKTEACIIVYYEDGSKEVKYLGEE